MSRLLFFGSYVIVIPSYAETEYHKHNMLHMFVGSEDSRMEICGQQYTGNIIFTGENVIHKFPEGDNSFFLLVDPTSDTAEYIRKRYLNDQNGCAVCRKDPWLDKNKGTDEEVIRFTEQLLEELSIQNKISRVQDERITELHRDISRYHYLGRRVADIAAEKHYSESWLVHLFKREAGISLKNYLMIKQFEYVWKQVLDGKSVTYAALESGFSSPSHFSAVCRQMTGISLSDVLR